MKRFFLAILLLFLLPASYIQAQGIPVFDAAVTLQTTLTAVSTAETVVNQILELTGLDELILAENLSTDLGSLSAIATEASGLGQDVATIQEQLAALFDLDTAPSTSLLLQERLVQIRRLTHILYVDSVRTEILLQASLSAIGHLIRLTEAIGGLLGNHQSNQTLVQLNTTLAVELMKLRTATGTFHKAQSVEHLTDPLIAQSMDNIREQVMADWPRP